MTEETKIHFDRASVLARAHTNEVWKGFVQSGDWARVTCDACRLERPAEKVGGAPEYRVPADVLQRDREVGQGDAAAFRLARLRALLADTRDAEEYAVRMIREFSSLLTDAVALKAELTARIGALRASRGVPAAREATRVPEAVQGLSGAWGVRHHRFEVGAGGTGAVCTAMIELADGTGDSCGRRPEDPVHAYVITWEDVRAMYARRTPERYRRAPVNSVDIRTDDGYAQGMTNLSDAAKTALLSASGNNVGTIVFTSGSGRTYRELRDASVIGLNGGLTRKGSIVRERLVSERLNDAFGEL